MLEENIATEATKDNTDVASGAETESASVEKKADSVVTPEAKKPDSGTEQKKNIPTEYKLTLPKESLLDPAKLEEVATYAKEKGLTNEEAQELLERDNAQIAAYVDKQNAEWNKQKEAWITEWKNDKEIGGADFQKNAELAKRVIDRFGDESLKKELNDTGFGNYLGLGRLLVKIGKAMSEDSLVIPGSVPAGDQRKSTAEVFYPTTKE